MPALANTTQKLNRASFARTLAHLTIGLGISTAASMFAGSAFSQQCDRCAASNSPSCGCESENGRTPVPSPRRCKCVPKPSLGEMLLSHFNKVGDRIEANVKKSNRSPTCGCEQQSPHCGCESISVQILKRNDAFQYSPTRMATPGPFPIDPSQFSNGSIGGNHLNESSAPIVAAPQTRQMQTSSADTLQPSTPPFAPAPETTLQRAPFEQRNPSTEHHRIPEAEKPPTNRYNPNTVNSTPSDPPPSWAPKSSRPTTTSPQTPVESKLPDVLVDPFKDDASFHGTRQRMEGILLSSDRQVSTNGLRIAPSDQAESQEAVLSPTNSPIKLTPAQLRTPSLQFEAAESDSSESSKVVSSNFLEALPVKVVVRKPPSKKDSGELPAVSRISVPNRR